MVFYRWIFLTFLVVCFYTGIIPGQEVEYEDEEYSHSHQQHEGTEIAWPMQYPPSEVFYQQGSPQQIQAYENYMQGCMRQFSKNDNADDSNRPRLSSLCEQKERERIEINARQPRSVHNYTHAGYAKVPIPTETFRILREFWDTTAKQNPSYKRVLEPWDRENIYTNHWESPIYIVPLAKDKNNHPFTTTNLSTAQRQLIFTEVQSVLEAWASSPLIPTSLYGIRVYGNNSILAPHVDRIPLILSAILNIDQDVETPWILQVIGHDGRSHNLTLQPGEMILYESHSILHGRPYPLQGNYYANVFVHFEPVGFTQQFHQKQQQQQQQQQLFDSENSELAERFQKALDRWTVEDTPDDVEQRQDRNRALPHWIPEHSTQAARWRQEFVFDRTTNNNRDAQQERPPRTTFDQQTKSSSFLQPPAPRSAHTLAADGDLEQLKQLVKEDPGIIHEADENGWQPIHEAARSGTYKTIRGGRREKEV
jgi:prolyl 4-hydroxylase